MKSLKTIVLSLLFATLSANVQAFFWSAPGKVTGFYTYSSGTAFFTVDNQLNPDNCSNGRYLALDSTTENFKLQYATLMFAMSTGQTVSINYNGCYGLYPQIIAIASPAIW